MCVCARARACVCVCARARVHASVYSFFIFSCALYEYRSTLSTENYPDILFRRANLLLDVACVRPPGCGVWSTCDPLSIQTSPLSTNVGRFSPLFFRTTASTTPSSYRDRGTQGCSGYQTGALALSPSPALRLWCRVFSCGTWHKPAFSHSVELFSHSAFLHSLLRNVRCIFRAGVHFFVAWCCTHAQR